MGVWRREAECRTAVLQSLSMPSGHGSSEGLIETLKVGKNKAARPEHEIMDTITIQIISFQMVLLVAILGFLWNLHRDVAGLRERMARVEGLLEGFVARSQESQS